jgi:hypothetical protein
MRKWLKEQCIEEIIDFGDLQVFQGATTYPCIMRICKSAPRSSFDVTQVETLEFQSLSDYVKENHYSLNQLALDDKGWSLADERTQELLGKIKSKGVPLGEYVGGKIYYGIKTGLNEAFVIDEVTRARLIAEDARSAELIKPFLAGRDIKRYGQPKSGKYLILMPRGWTKERSSNARDTLEWLKENYPAIANHLLPFSEAAEKRCDKGEHWWELRACDYYDEFKKPKTMLPDISIRGNFIIDETGGVYSANTTYIICSADKYLIGLLNSSLMDFCYRNLTAVFRGGYLRFFTQYMIQLPIHTIDFSLSDDSTRHNRIVVLVDQMITLHKQLKEARTPHEQTAFQRQIEATDGQIDALVYELYGLTEEEIMIVEGTKSN